MSTQRSLERSIAAWMADEAAGTRIDVAFDNILDATSRVRPEPRWLALLKESPMRSQSRVTVGSPTRRLVLILGLMGLLLIGAAAAALAMRQSSTADDWPQLRQDAAHASTTAQGPVGNPVARWVFHAQGAIAENISVAGDLALAPSDDGALHAIDINTGEERWSVQLDGPAGGPAVADGTVFISDGNGAIHALSLADGSEWWPSSVPLAAPTAPIVDGDRVYLGTGDGYLVALNAATGAIVWQTEVSPDGLPVYRVPALSDGRIFAGVQNGPFVAVQASDGKQLWSAPGNGSGYGTPVVSGKGVYISGGGGLRALDVASGDVRWQTDDYGTPALAGQIGIGGTDAGDVIAYDLSTGVVRWQVSFVGPMRPAAVAGNDVYVSADGEQRIYALDVQTGQELWSFALDGANECCVAASHGLVVVGTLSGSVYAIAGDGASLQLHPHVGPTPTATPAPATPAPAAASASPASEPLASFAWQATSPGAGFVSAGLARAPDGNLWVSDVGNNAFAIFSPDGTYLGSWGKTGKGEGEFNLRRENDDPYGAVAFAPDGSFFVLDVGNRRVQAFDAKRHFVTQWGGFGTNAGSFIDPVGIAVGPDGNVSVLDDARSVIETYRPDGTVVGAFGPLMGVNNGANGMTIDHDGNYYVTAIDPNQVQRFDPHGTPTGTFGAPGSGPGVFTDQPMQIAVDAEGRVFVTQIPSSSTSQGVHTFAADGTFLGSWGQAGKDPGQLGFPWGIMLDDAGNAYVSEFGGDPGIPSESRLQKFQLALP